MTHHGMSDVSYHPFSEMRVLAVPDESSSRTAMQMRVLAVPDESSSRNGMEMRVLAVLGLHDESSSRTIDYYAVDHFYTSLFRFIVGFDPRLPSHTNSIKLYRLTRVVRQIDLLTASVS